MGHVDRNSGRSAFREPLGCAILDDLAGLPATEAELDVIEAFLSAALRELLNEDSEPPQTHAEIAAIPRGPRARQ
jgi:hypothetical protein